MPGHGRATQILFLGEPDWELELVKKGIARVGEGAFASDYLFKAEAKARANREGRWSNAYVRTTPVPAAEVAEARKSFRRPSLLPPRTKYVAILTSLAAALVGSAAYAMGGKPLLFSFIFASGIGGIAAVVNIWLRWRLNRYVDLVMIGSPGSGKTWLLHRLAYPEAQEESFYKLPPSDGTEFFSPEQSFPIGAKEIFPTFVADPGGKPQMQARSMYEHKGLRAWLARLRSERRVWMIVIAPGRGGQVDMRDTAPRKVHFSATSALHLRCRAASSNPGY